MSQISNQLDYKKETYLHPTYRLNKILPLSGQTTQTVPVPGGTENVFELPVVGMNLARSFITFQFRVPALAARYNNIYKDCFPHWRQIQLYTRSGIYICDLNELANYTKITFNSETPLKDFLDLDFMSGVTGGTDGPPVTFPGATANPGAIGSGYHFHRSGVLKDSYTGNAARPAINGAFGNNPTLTFPNAAVNTAPGGTIHIPPLGSDIAGLNLGNITLAGMNATTPAASNLDYTEPSYVYRSAAVNQPVTMNVQIPLSCIKDTIFAIDKDIYFNEIILLRIVWSPSVKIAFTNSAALSLVTDAAALNASVAVQNLTLYLAVEKNPEITNQLISQVAGGGFNMLIPYVYQYKNALTGTSQNVSLRFNRGHGRRLMKIIHAPFNSTESSLTAYDHNNINGDKITTYYTMLNNERLQEFNVDCTQLDDYNLHRDYLKDKVLQNSNIYQYNWFHMDRWDGESKDPSNLESGLDLSIEQKWDIYTTSTTPLNHYDYAITQKMLTVSSAGITVL